MRSSVPAKWKKLFGLIPNYDPIATAGDAIFNVEVAEKACRFFPLFLTHIEGDLAGTPFKLEPWQQAIIGCAFGWKNPDGRRRYREVFQYVPRKNGKSTQLGGLINLVAFCDDEPGAQIYSAAAEREQAALVYRQAKGQILQNPELARAVKIYQTFKSIEYPGGTIFKALSADADTKHGFNSHFVCIDELHAHRNRDLVEVLLTSTGSRRQPLVWYITTADYDRESVCNEKYDYASRVRDGIINDRAFLPIIYEAKPDDDYTDPKVWAKANPNLGVSISHEYLARECNRAKESSTYRNTFLRLHLNVRTQNDVTWLKMERWDASAGSVKWNDMDAFLKGRPCYCGVDLASTTDIAAMSMVFPDGVGGFDVLWRFWVPEINAKRRQDLDRVPYMAWISDGLISATAGDWIDYDQIRKDINELGQQFDIREIAIDRWNATQLSQQLMGDGFSIIPFGQGFASMTAPTKELEKLVLAGQLRHGANPVARWMAGNVSVEIDAAGNIKPTKKKSTEKIDGMVALIMGLGRAGLQEGESTYEKNDLMFL